MPLKNRDGVWYYRFTYRGQEYMKSTGLSAIKRNATAASSLEAAALARLKGGKPIEEQAPDGIAIGMAAADYLAWKEGEHREHPGTARRARTSFVSLKKFFQGFFVHEITSGHIEKFKTWRRSDEGGPVREVTIRHDLHTLSDFFRYARKHNWTKSDPLLDVDIPSDKDAVRDYVLTDLEERKYFAAALAENVNLHDLGRLMIDQGFRPEEVMSFTVFHYNREQGKLTVARGKSDASRRTLLLTPESRAIVERRVREAKALNTRWLFPSPRDPQKAMTKVNNPHQKVLLKTNLRFTLYELRHTFATRMGERGVSAPMLAALLGHSSLRCVMRYCHIRQEATDAAMLKARHGAGLVVLERKVAE